MQKDITIHLELDAFEPVIVRKKKKGCHTLTVIYFYLYKILPVDKTLVFDHDNEIFVS